MGRRKKKNAKWIMHYSSKHEILLVGEGDFSFAVSLAEAFGDATNMVATSLDSRSSVVRKYRQGEKNLETLEEYGCTVLHGVDVNSMDRHLEPKGFDMIVFNFPHAACGSDYIDERCELQIKRHRKLVKGFLMNAVPLLRWNGEIHVTTKTGHPYSEWKVEELAEEVGLKLLEEVGFSKWDYPGYHNKKCYGSHPDRTFPVGCSSTFKFILK
ncbi:hypothetical protein MLD38_000884 [Melastoma candidum]|nr:hypothetical protein MLD38_000884 [Melastoma candidum]